MLKKQTVWLLTMLSLIIVLSVYYMTSPTPSPSNQLAATTGHQKNNQKEKPKSNQQSKGKQGQNKKPSVATSIAGQATFATAQMKKDDARSKLRAQLTSTIASKNATAEQQAKAEQKLQNLNHLSSEESMLESLIIAKGYGNDALVNTEGNKIRVYVQTKSLSNKQAAEIMNLVEKKLHIPTEDIYVTYKPQNQ